MRLLIDTQCWLWMQAEPERFSERMRARLADPGTELLLSAASAWEIAIKYALGKLALPMPPHEYVPSRMQISATTALPVLHSHALRVAALPPHHRDPFDRLIVAQAQLESVAVLTADRGLDAYEIETLRP
jgi:PIN domain nuclease of toxin-antitoxin system